MPEIRNQTNLSSGEISASGCLIRLCWMFIGNVALFFTAVYIWHSKSSVFSLLDIIFWGIVLFTIIIRHLDIRKFKGLTMKGDGPATMAHWRRYSAVLVLISLLIWGVAHGLAWLNQ
jgi:hypothetical protein